MSGKRDSGSEAVSWLATGVVCFLGVLFCGVILLTFANEPGKPILVMSGVFVALAVVLYVLREKPKDAIINEEEKWFGLFRKPKAFTRYKLTRHRKPKIVQFGTNAPPTADHIREIKEANDGMNNWTPPETAPHHLEKR
ncbi:MAG: MFS transporter [Planctomycetes bacterium]|nr:MFS transporter [Planctomycetota bacterium]